MTERRRTRKIYIGNVPIGGDAPISVQSMTTTSTADVDATVEQIHRLEEAGCSIVRVAVPDRASAEALGEIRGAIRIPLVADIHFNHTLALVAVAQGVDAIRWNPGNITQRRKVEEIVGRVKERGIPIRIGVNAGSLEKDLLGQYGPTPEALVESALRNVRVLEELGWDSIKISIKSSNVSQMVAAYRMISERVDYPLHLGVTEAGTPFGGTIKSSIGIGALLLQGIGDTLRVSLTGDPVEEVRVGREILRSLGLLREGVDLIACPTCGRCDVDMISMVEELEPFLQTVKANLKVAVMGCEVNGPGEAREADVGVAIGRETALLFRHGEVVRKIRTEQVNAVLREEIERLEASDPPS